AGVIGKSRYTYDMWGESVNLASRMQSSGIADRVQISEAAYHRLRSRFQCELRGEMEIKGLGLTKTYFLDAQAGVLDGPSAEHSKIDTRQNSLPPAERPV